MLIYRFDDEVARPIAAFGSRFSIARLVHPGADVVVQVMHLPPSGLIGRHPATVRQLLAVVAGSGEVSGADGRRRSIGPGRAALWEPGEEHETTTVDGLTAVCIEGRFEVAAALVTKEIVVVDHDPAWSGWFDRIHDLVWPAVEEVAVRIDHVGSTAVPGLAAKPIIDLDVVVATDGDAPAAIERLATLGYEWRGNLGIEGREAFDVPAGSDLPAHHLYLVVDQNRAHLDHVLLRDLLRTDASARARYGELKRGNAESGDMDEYLAGKAALVAELLTRARAERGLPPVDYWAP